MVSYDEKQRLLRDFHHEPAWALGVVLKCAACLLILVGFAVIGITTDLQSDAHSGAAAEGGSRTIKKERASVVESRNAFEERRARFEGQSTAPQCQAAH